MQEVLMRDRGGLSKNIDDAIHRPHDESRLKEQKQDEDTQKTNDNPECPVRRYPHEILCLLTPETRIVAFGEEEAERYV